MTNGKYSPKNAGVHLSSGNGGVVVRRFFTRLRSNFFRHEQRLENWFMRAVKLEGDEEKYFRAVALLRLLIASLPFHLATMGTIMAVDSTKMEPIARVIGISLLAFQNSALLVALWQIRANQISRARNTLAISSFLSILVAIQVTGGVFNSFVAPLLVVVPLIHFCFFDIKRGVLAAFLVPLVSILVDMINAQFNLGIQNLTSTVDPAFNTLLVASILYVVVVLALFSQGRSNGTLRDELREERQQLIDMVNRDSLTGLANGRFFRTRLEQANDQIDRDGGKLALVYIDLDKFKPINDRFGHVSGDKILCEIADRLGKFCGPNDCVARLGGDEFAILFSNIHSHEQVAQMSSMIGYSIGLPTLVEEQIIRVSASVGFCIYPDGSTNRDQIIEVADQAMYDQKRQRNQPA